MRVPRRETRPRAILHASTELAEVRLDPAQDPSAADPIDKLSCRPDFQGLIYGGPYTVETFSDQTPPSFLACAYNDSGNVVKQANLFLKLQAAKIPAELHIYSTGGHGFGVRTDRAIAVQTWPQRFVDWMGDIGMLGSKR
jgi:endo-1,4-beta-xylanase